jgi:hypothetical protein
MTYHLLARAFSGLKISRPGAAGIPVILPVSGIDRQIMLNCFIEIRNDKVQVDGSPMTAITADQ